jgi:hypothetical protein
MWKLDYLECRKEFDENLDAFVQYYTQNNDDHIKLNRLIAFEWKINLS